MYLLHIFVKCLQESIKRHRNIYAFMCNCMYLFIRSVIVLGNENENREKIKEKAVFLFDGIALRC